MYQKRKIIFFHISFIIFLSIIFKITIAIYLKKNFQPETWEYEQLAVNMLKNGSYEMEYREYGSYRALLAPGYSFLCCGIYKLFGINHKLMLVIQFILMTFFSVIIYFLTFYLLRDLGIAFISGILSAIHPGLNYYTVAYLHNLTLYVPLFYLSVLLFCLSFNSTSPLPFIASGISSGLAVLARATFTPVFILSLVIYVLVQNKLSIKIRLKNVFFSFIFFFAINAPWVIRNYTQFNKFIFSQNNKWEAFWVGNNPNASGGHYLPDGTVVLSTKPAKMQEEIYANKGDEIAIEGIFKKYSMQYIKEEPVSFIKGLIRKSFYFWWFYPQTGLFYPRSFLIAYKLLYVLLLILSICGFYLYLRKKSWQKEMLFLFALMVGIWIAHTINFMEMRHRWTIEPILLIFAAVTVSYTLSYSFSIFSSLKK
ncbi:MAG TPA: hypothetical protein P5270_04655 [Victivallales bacterium]|nr:hypothetical protein [Victivallales bacterium]HPO89560.1 hypothetical protein [Victivallales bacterium]HRR28632.1 hypothetical protein [Victivallales bacterium]HRU00391.1 hypothetical protein [Victivallales bacterium]